MRRKITRPCGFVTLIIKGYEFVFLNIILKYSGVCYNERCYNERMLQRTNATTNSFFFNKIRMLQRTQMLQRTRRYTIGRRSTRVRMTCRAFPLRLERQSSSLLPFIRFSYQISSVICLFVQRVKVK